MNKNIVKLSLTAAMILTTGAYSNQIVGADAADGFIPTSPQKQFGFGGLNLENVNVNMILGDIFTPIEFTDGEYPQMDLGDSYQSSVFSPDDNKSDEDTRLGYITQKIWPISEPTGIKVVNDDVAVSNGKPENCIMASSYLGAEDKEVDPTTYYLNDGSPAPVLCSSYAGSSKRFQLVLNENMVAEIDQDGYGKSIDLVFNIGGSTGVVDRYQVFQKVSNFTDMRLDGFTIEVLDSTGNQNTNLTLSLGEGEERDRDDQLTGGDLWPSYEYAFYPPGLWGDGTKKHLEKGWFDIEPAGFNASLTDQYTMTSGTRLPGNYNELFGVWQPEKWTPLGMHEVVDPLEGEPVLIAYWGTTPTETFNDAPNWHYGMDHDLSDGDQSFAIPSDDVLAMWAADLQTPDNPDGKYVIDYIEDIPNVSMNYIVNVGDGIDNNITIRITPKVSENQDAPSYISKEDNVTYILPTLPPVDPTDPTDPTDPIDPTDPNPSSGGGGCTYNPNSNNFDMTFLIMMALGLLYPFRRRFLK